MGFEQTGARETAPEQGGDAAEEVAYRLRQQQIVSDFGLCALQTQSIADLLQEAARVSALGLQTELSKIMEFVPAKNEFIVRAGVGWNPGVVGIARMSADLESPTGYAFKTGEPVISSHLAQGARFRTPQILAAHGVKRALNVAIRSDGEPFGVLEVDSPHQERFTRADIAFLQGIANLLGVAIHRQQSQDRLKASEARVQQAYEHQEVLTREISHRVKNSLRLVASLLNLQARTSNDEDLRHALVAAEARVQTIAQVHERLWRQDKVQTIDLAGYLGDLCRQLAKAFPQDRLSYEIAPVMVPTDRAVSLGVLLNELVTNAFKYAYPDGDGEVRVSLTTDRPEHLRLEVSDRGVGLPADFNPSRSKSLGMKIISSLTQQLGGRQEWQDAQPGTRFILHLLYQDDLQGS